MHFVCSGYTGNRGCFERGFSGNVEGVFRYWLGQIRRNDQRAHTNSPRYCHIVGGPRYSVLRNSAMAMASIAAPMNATMARDSPSGTTQPNHVMPGLRVCTASRLTARWPNTAERIGSTM